MPKPKKAQFQVPPKRCPYCLELGASSDDHIPPRIALLTALPNEQECQFITVRACPACNSQFSTLDTHFAQFLSLWLGTEKQDRWRLWKEQVLPTIISDKRRHRELLATMEEIVLVDPAGASELRTTISFDSSVPYKMCDRLVRGLFCFMYRSVLPRDLPIASELYTDLGDYADMLAELPQKCIGKQFKFWIFRPDKTVFDMAWFFEFHEGLSAIAYTGSKATLADAD